MPGHRNLGYENDDYVNGGVGCDVSRRNNYAYGDSSRLPQVYEGMSSLNTRISRRSYISVAILCFINLINYMDRFTVAGVLEDVKAYYKIGNTEAGLLQTSFIVSYMIMAPVFGYLGDRYSRKYIMAFGVTFWSLTTLAGSFIPKNMFGAFIFLRALVGTGEASYSTIAPTIIADLFSKDHRSRMLAFFYFAIPVGSGLGYIAGSQIAAGLGSWHWALRLTPGLGILSVILTFTCLREPPRGEAEGGSHVNTSTVTSDLADLCRTKSFIWSTCGFTCVTFATGALAWWAPLYMGYAMKLQAADANKDKASLIFGAITCIAGIVGVLCGSVASQYLRKSNPRADPLICAFGVLACVPLLYAGCVIADRQIELSWILIFLGEVCLCVNWTIVADMLLYVIIPTRRSIAEAVQILVSHAFGDASSPYIVGIISDVIMSGKTQTYYYMFTSLQYALYVPAFVLILGGLCFFMTALHIEKDKMRCSLVTHGFVPPLPCYPDDVSFPQPVQLAADDAVWPDDLRCLV